jgi:hypothetical protein
MTIEDRLEVLDFSPEYFVIANFNEYLIYGSCSQ